MIAIIDYDAGNIRSALNALTRIGKEAFLTSDPFLTENADFVVLPGVGSFGQAADELSKRGLDRALKARFYNNRPILGICLGLQLMFEYSEESPNKKGLGFFKGGVKKLESGGLEIPHIGWTDIRAEDEVFRPFDGEFFYFVHSYAACPEDRSIVAAQSDYGKPFVCAVRSGRTAACQFHPEKSGEKGLKLLKALIESREGTV